MTFDRVFRDVRNRLLEERQSYCTTFIDYYGIDSKFPGKETAKKAATAANRYSAMHQALAEAVAAKLPQEARRFIPHVQIYEFEALLFADPHAFSREICRPDLAARLEEITTESSTPEDIDDGTHTSPSHRIVKVFPEYEKVSDGSLVALGIGLTSIRAACPCFASWLDRLEDLEPEA